jgi:phenylacetic acid degradation protein paaN
LEFTPIGRGIALLIGCNTFPTWNGFPGFFASLATGNAVLVKPHPRAVLPLALTVSIAREVLREYGFDADLVCLAAERPGEGIAKSLALRPEVRIIDYTGSTAFGDWLEENARQAQVYSEKSGVNTVVIDSTDDYRGMLANLAFSLSLYSGQMCTTPQNLLVPRGGVGTDEGHKSAEELGTDLSTAVDNLLGNDARANALLGALVNPAVKARLERAATMGRLVLASRSVANPEFPGAVVRTPAMVAVDAGKAEDQHAFLSECFGPVSFLVQVDSTADAVHLLRRSVREFGAMTVSAYSTSESVKQAVVEACLDSGASLSLNLTDGVYVNQTAAFADLHGTGANPAANAAICDSAFVANRFRTVEVRRHG